MMALANAQEFMVQVAVEKKKSNTLVAKLAEGVSVQLYDAYQALNKGLGNHVKVVSHDFLVYLDRRSKMYHGIALKYKSKVKLEEEKYGERVAVLEAARQCLGGLKITPLKVKKKFMPLSSTLQILSGSIKDQLRATNALYREATSDNETVYHYKVPSYTKHDSVDHMKFVKLTEFTPPEAQVLLITQSQMDELTIDDGLGDHDEDLTMAISASMNDMSRGRKPAKNEDADLSRAIKLSLEEKSKPESKESKNNGGDGPVDPNAPTAPTVSYI